MITSLAGVIFSSVIIYPELQNGCMSIFPRRINEAKPEEAVYPWKICQKVSGECITAEYGSANARPVLVGECFTYRSGEQKFSWCGMEIASQSLPKRVIYPGQKEQWSDWLEYMCVDTTNIDLAIDNAFRDFTNECAHLVVVTGKRWDCNGNPMTGIEMLSGVPLKSYQFPK